MVVKILERSKNPVIARRGESPDTAISRYHSKGSMHRNLCKTEIFKSGNPCREIAASLRSSQWHGSGNRLRYRTSAFIWFESPCPPIRNAARRRHFLLTTNAYFNTGCIGLQKLHFGFWVTFDMQPAKKTMQPCVYKRKFLHYIQSSK